MRARVESPPNHEHLAFCEIFQKVKDHLFGDFRVFCDFCEIIEKLVFPFLVFSCVYVFKQLFKHFWVPGKIDKIEKFLIFREFCH